MLAAKEREEARGAREERDERKERDRGMTARASERKPELALGEVEEPQDVVPARACGRREGGESGRPSERPR